MDPKNLKQQAYHHCLQYIEERIEAARLAMEAAQKSANEETKSSAGDKYETGRAMAQLERDKHAVQLAEAMKLKNTLESINPEQNTETAKLGSLVITNSGIFYLSISAGKMQVNSLEIFAVAPAAPMGQVLLGKKAGDSFAFRGQNMLVEKVY